MTDQDTLARTICGEARGEGYAGMAAVANVVVNRFRAQKPRWGLTIAEVCRKPYQFSCWDEGDPNLPIIEALDETKGIFRDALDIARKAVGGFLPDLTRGATFYYAKGTPAPKWAEGHEPCAAIGRHLFFNDVE